MILNCPSCKSRFNVPDGMIPEAGRIVRCSKCTHEWFVQRETPSFSPDDFDPLRDLAPPPPSVEQSVAQEVTFGEVPASEPPPARARIRQAMHRRASDREESARITKPLRMAVPLLAASWVVLALIAYFPSWSNVPGLGGIYRALGASHMGGLAFEDVKMEREQEGSKTRFVLSGSVKNHSGELRVLPTVRVQLRNKENASIWSREYAVNHEIPAGGSYPFRITNVETTFAGSVASILVDMGNSMQLMVR